ncbi:MAG TPA: hemerythrin domain-containing protein [Candidatus Sulfotelmatobacter sp.]|jgi:hemerythrin-like domain-containing protein
MLRDKNLIPLSRQHQHALALCVRIDRASPIGDADLSAWQAEIAQQFQMEIGFHFAAEEQVLFPGARKFQELVPLVDDLIADHAALRARFAQAEGGKMHAADLSAFAQRMSAHIRKEERQLFERMQGLMTQEELARLGENLQAALADAAQACALPANATRLRSAIEAGAEDSAAKELKISQP